MKQTAVDWLHFELLKNIIELQRDYKNTNEIWKKAKEMEKKQIIDAYKEGHYDGQLTDLGGYMKNDEPELYYQTTYK